MDLESLNTIGLKCPYPRKVKVPALDKYGDYRPENGVIYVPCGKCYVCLSARRMQWQFRLEMESLQWSDSLFVTLTLDDEHLHDVNKRDLQLFFKFLRNRGHVFRYYGIGEYGTRTFRPHYHVIFFTDDGVSLSRDIMLYWDKGFTYFGSVTPSSLGYVLHYHIRPKIVNGKSTFCVFSKGLGVDWFDLNMQKYVELKDDFFVHNRFGSVNILPRYYRKKFLSSKSVKASKDKYQIGSNKHDFEYLLSLREAFAAKLNKFNNQDKL